jgi:hypothetical protein
LKEHPDGFFLHFNPNQISATFDFAISIVGQGISELIT